VRVLLLQAAPYAVGYGGAPRANRCLLEALAARGHRCRALAPAGDDAEGDPTEQQGVEVHTAPAGALRKVAKRQIADFAPDRVLVSSEDPAQQLFEAALEAGAAVVYLAHTTLNLPCGPDAFLPSAERTARLRRAAAVVAVSRAVADYLGRHAGVAAEVLRFPVYGGGPYLPAHAGEDGFVTLINPCAVKGIAVFLALARALPRARFAAVPTWGTTGDDLAALAALPNVTVLPPRAAVREIFARTRVLLVPSLWHEAFGQVAVEAMLHGVPVLASAVGGLPEAKLGVPHLLPVAPIARFTEDLDDRRLPKPVVPPQDIAPWREALAGLLADPAAWRELSEQGRAAALAFVAGARAEPFEELLARPPALAASGASGSSTVAAARADAGPMRLLFAQPLDYLFAWGGAHKCNRALFAAMAARGHRCQVVTPLGSAGQSPAQVRAQLAGRGARIVSTTDDVVVFEEDGFTVHGVTGGVRMVSHLLAEARAFDPTWVVLTEDTTHLLLPELLAVCPSRVVYLAHSPATLPFGPAAFSPDPALARPFRRLAGVVTVSDALSATVREHGGIAATTFRFPVYGSGPFPRGAGFEDGLVTLVNPAGIKGLPIFLELARRLPGVRFGAVATWAARPADRAALAALPNVELLAPRDDIDEIFARTRVLLAPSLWGEAFGVVVVEAMLRGIPVLASDQGGLPEAKLGVPYVLPVRPIERYVESGDPAWVAEPVIPPQDVGPWLAALTGLLADRALWEELSEASRRAAHAFVAGLSFDPFEAYLRGLAPRTDLHLQAQPERPADPAAALPPGLAGLSPEKRALLLKRLRQRGRERAGGAIPPSPLRARGGPFPLSFAQRRLWFLDRLEPAGPAAHTVANEPLALHLRGGLAPAVLAGALAAVVRRHEVLRTRFAERDGEPVQWVEPPPVDGPPLPRIDLAALPAGRREGEARRLAGRLHRQPFDLRQAVLLRAALFELAAEERVLLLVSHHIAADHWSIGLVLAELAELLAAGREARPALLPALPLQYADFADWQQGWLAAGGAEPHLGAVRAALAGAPPVVTLPADRPRPAVQSGRGGQRRFALPPALATAARALAQLAGCTVYALLLAAFQALVHRLTGQEDLVVGSPAAGRTRLELERLVGCFLNLLALRGRPHPELSFEALAAAAHQAALAAAHHQELLPFELLVEDLRPARSLAHAPLFQLLFNFQNIRLHPFALPGLAVAPWEVAAAASKLDLEMYLEEYEGGLSGVLVYAADLFDPATVARWGAAYVRLIEGALARPAAPLGELALLSPAEIQQLREHNDTAAPLPAVCLHELVLAQAARTPDAAAVGWEGGALSYADLTGPAAALAGRLRQLGVGPEVRVALAAERSPELMVGLLAILCAGGAWVPLDPDAPAERLAGILDDAAPALLLAQPGILDRLGARAAGLPVVLLAPGGGAAEPAPPLPRLDPGHLAYVLYTSGSTGRPKGAMNSHRAIVNRLLWMQRAYGLAADDRVLQKTPIGFDVSVWELFWPLVTGACLVLARPGGHRDPGDLAEVIERERITTLHFVPSLLQLFLAVPDLRRRGAGLRRVIASGEALPADLQQRAAARLAAPLHNLYGPTEAAVDVTAWPCDPAGEADPVPIGRPVDNTAIHLADRALRPVAPGAAGELLIGGVQPARGYLGRPDLTAERFVPDPFGAAPGGRLYRTGDLARRRQDGALEFLGRLDDQVKIRGVRVEPGEVAAALAALPGVREAAVVVRPGPDGPRLVAYLVETPAGDDPGDLRAALRDRLPEAMIPTAFVRLPALPLSPNGKLDRRALPDPPDEAAAWSAPRGPLEELIAGVFAELLGLDPATVGGEDDFFRRGGHSLLAVRLLWRLRELLGAELPLARLFETPTVAGLAAAAAAAHRGQTPEPPVRLLPRSPDGPTALPASFAQERLWFLERFAPGSGVYNMPAAVRLAGTLAVPALAAAFAAVVHRHEALRTTFRDGGEDGLRQVIAPPSAAPRPLPVVDLRALPVAGPAEAGRFDRAEADRLAAAEASRPFDLTAGPLLRTVLLRLAPDLHLALVTLHHAVADGWSVGILVEEVAALYARAASRSDGADGADGATRLPALPAQPADLAAWQRAALAGGELERRLAWWSARLAGAAAAPLALPADRQRPPVASGRGGRRPLAVPPALAARLRALGRQEGATPFMVLLTAFQLLLGRLAGRQDVTVGVPAAGRDLPQSDRLIGCFVETLPLRLDLADRQGFRELLGRQRGAVLGAFAHAVPFDRLIEELCPRREAAVPPLVQTLFALQDLPGGALALPGLRLERVAVESGRAKLDLTLGLSSVRVAGEGGGDRGGDRDDGRGYGGALEFSRDLFDPATAERLASRWLALLAAACDDPGRPAADLPLLSAAERHQVTVEWRTWRLGEGGNELVPEMIAAAAAAYPAAPALVWDGGQIAYRDLAARVGRLARALREASSAPPGGEELVAVCAPRSPRQVACVAAVLAAGKVYLPLDPELPPERLRQLLADARPALVVTDGPVPLPEPDGSRRLDLAALWAATATDTGDTGDTGAPAPPAALLAEQAAYVLYTSGSTGRPKGVVVSHGALARRLRHEREVESGPGERFLHKTTTSFDVSLTEMLGPLVAGGAVALAAPGEERDPRALVRRLRSLGVTQAAFPASALQALLEGDPDGLAGCPRLRLVLTGGETVPAALAERFAARVPGVELRNRYGPTETTISLFEHRCGGPRARLLPIGRPFAGAEGLVLDSQLQPAGIGVPGELCLGSGLLARGYLGDPAKTAERFVPHPFDVGRGGGRLYRTGDRARQRPDGAVEHLGRLDRQVKIRGVRVEPGEVEAALAACPGVREAAVVVRREPEGDALVACAAPAELDRAALRAALAERLPASLLPAAVVLLPALPRTAAGKVDAAALAALVAAATAETPAASAEGVEGGEGATGDPLEELLAGVFAELLPADRRSSRAVLARPIGRDDDFFALGGHSLLAARAAGRIGELLGVELPLRTLFEAPTPALLAPRAAALRRAGAPPPRPIVPLPRAAAGPTVLPASFAQERLWFLERAAPGRAVYNMPAALRLTGRLEVAALAAAFAGLVRRHEALRTTFREEAAGVCQAIAPPAEGVAPLPVIDLAALPAQRRDDAAAALAAAEARRPFDLAAGPLLRTALVRLEADRHLALVTVHHAVADGWSAGLLVQEVAARYAQAVGGPPGDRPAPPALPALPALPVQPADVAVWQRGLADEAAGALAWWRERLAGLAEAPLELPADRPRPALPSFLGGHRPVRVDAALAGRLCALGRRAGATPFMLLLTAWQLLLGRLAERDDVAVGVPAAGRGRPETAGLIGFFVDTLVLRLALGAAPGSAGDRPSFGALLGRQREAVLGAFAHREIPFERLVAELQPRRDPAVPPLVQVLFAFQNLPGGDLALPGLRLERLAVESGRAKLDLTLALGEAAGSDGGFAGVLEHSRDLFDPATAERLAGRLLALLAGAAGAPDRPAADLPLLAPAERHQVLVEWRTAGPAPAGDALVVELIAAAAAAFPRAPALVWEGGEMSYGELAARAARLARRLADAGAGPEVPVAVCAPRSPRQVVCAVAVFAAGGVYLPLDPTLPAERFRQLLADARPALVVGEGPDALAELRAGTMRRLDLAALWEETAGRGEPGEPALTSVAALLPAQAAYLLYTSGSTGRPKGVVVSHGALGRRLRHERAVEIGPGDRFLHKTTASFDVSLTEMLGPLVAGGAVALAPPGAEQDPAALLRCIRTLGVTLTAFPPGPLRALLDGGELAACPSLRRVLTGAEPVPPELPVRFAERSPAELRNRYGPTEATISLIEHRCGPRREPILPIGRPFAGAEVLVLDRALQPVGPGLPGELCLGGGLLARGYRNDPATTAERFVPHPFAAAGEGGGRLYRTGDRARHRPDGALELLGRLDRQVKIRGFRVEPGEVEAALAACPGVREAVVTVGEEPGGGRVLIGFAAAEGATAAALRSALRDRLPAYMVPAALVLLPALPRTAAGKVDVAALPAPREAGAGVGSGESVGPGGPGGSGELPATEVEQTLAALWAEVLGIDPARIGLQDDFFDLGGHSLRATQVLLRIRERFGVDLPVRRFFEAPTVAGLTLALAEHLLAAAADDDDGALAGLLAGAEGRE
jgi:amino acid adenylation domain-containing protein